MRELMPDIIPAGAANVLGLGEREDGFLGKLPFGRHKQDLRSGDWPELYWDSPNGQQWYWRRKDWPIVAVQRSDGTWERQSATY